MASNGDKFIIEIESSYIAEVADTPARLYRIKGFNSLVFDEAGLEKLTPVHARKTPSHGFEVGDEVLDDTRCHGVVILSTENGVIYMDANTIDWYVPVEEISKLHKTGVRYPEFGMVLSMLEERDRQKGLRK